MPINFDNPVDHLEWLRQLRIDTQDRRVQLHEYATRNSCWYLGMQWAEQNGGGDTPFGKVVEGVTDAYNQAVGRNGPQPLRVTLNKITENTIAASSAVKPRKLDVVATPDAGLGRPGDMAERDVVEAIANATLEDSGALEIIRRASFERCINGFQGFGHNIEVTQLPDGRVDSRQQCFEFKGYQLTLDPTNSNQNLSTHETVTLTRVMGIVAARRVFGTKNLAGIDEKKLPQIGQLMTVESRWNSLTGGRMFPDVGRLSRQPGLVVHVTFVRGSGKRFDRMYIAADASTNVNTANADRVVLNWEANEDGVGNPYGGVGMPLHTLYGWDRPGEIHGIADVAMQIDAQEKLNLNASMWFQCLSNYTQKLLVIDPRGLEDDRLGIDGIRRQMREGVIRWTARSREARPPTVLEFPQPPQSISAEIERHSRDIRQATFRTDSHVGDFKTHVSPTTVARGIELSEIASEDRVDSDIRTYERFIESLVSTQIRLAQSGHDTPVRLMQEAGLNNRQMGAVQRIDAMRQLPQLKISEEAIRRRSASQKKQDVSLMIQSGALADDPSQVRRIYAEYDMPISEDDKQWRQYANLKASEVLRGLPFEPEPLGPGTPYMVDALRRALTRATIPMVKRQLRDAIVAQQQADGATSQPQEPTIEEAMSAAFNPAAVRV